MSFGENFSLAVLPGLTVVSLIATFFVLITSWNETCEGYENYPAHAWLVTYTIFCLPGSVVAFFTARGRFLKGSDIGPAAGAAFIFAIIFVMGSLVWNIVGYVLLFGNYPCFSNPLGVMMLIDIIYQSFSILFAIGLYIC